MNDFALYLIVGGYWALSVSYCLRWHFKEGNLNYGTFFVSLLIGPAIIFILFQHQREIKKEREEIEERETNEGHRGWFRTMSEINRQRMTSFGRTIPPPPPLSRITQAQSERDEAIRSARERVDKNKLKDFKFLRSNVKDIER